jgi:hypothetical protein
MFSPAWIRAWMSRYARLLSPRSCRWLRPSRRRPTVEVLEGRHLLSAPTIPGVQIDGPVTLGAHNFSSSMQFAPVGDAPLTFQADGSSVRFSALESVANNAVDGLPHSRVPVRRGRQAARGGGRAPSRGRTCRTC